MALVLPEAVGAFLERHHVMTLATQGPAGPWAAAVFYARSGDDLIFLSAPHSRHARDLAAHPRCAATIQGQDEDWSAIQGVQLEGVAEVLEGDSLEAARQAYAQRFAFVRPESAPAAIAAALARVQWHRLRIARLFFIDNRLGFGQRQQFDA